MLILDLCGGTGAWSQPYADAGYRVEIVDPLVDGRDVRLWQRLRVGVQGILAAPPCTKFAVSGNGTRAKEKAAGTYDDGIRDALSVVDACLRIAWVQQPAWWCLENPVGTLVRYLGLPRMVFNPADYGDPYTKKTLLWGQFTCPPKSPIVATEGSKMHLFTTVAGSLAPAESDGARIRSGIFQGESLNEQTERKSG